MSGPTEIPDSVHQRMLRMAEKYVERALDECVAHIRDGKVTDPQLVERLTNSMWDRLAAVYCQSHNGRLEAPAKAGLPGEGGDT